MEINLLKEVIECLDDGRRLVHYYRDMYAVYLLRMLVRAKGGLSVSEIKSGAYAKLLNKDIIKKATAQCGKGLLTEDILLQAFSTEFESYVVTLSTWGNQSDYLWNQTSRPGANLVIQLNFSREQEQLIGRYKLNSSTFKCYSHPVHSFKYSLAWVRVDFDFASGEALIEEIQNDWLRKAERHLQLATSAIQSGRSDYSCYGEKYNAEAMLSYTQKVLKRYSKTWSEAAMFSAIHLIKEELGINKIFYHHFGTGRYMKNVTGACPPKSLYSRLPKSFCFTQTNKGPDFILSNKKIKRRLNKLKDPNWYYLEVGC